MSKVVIITGASGGLGSAMATRFAGRGDKVVLNYHTAQAAAEELAEKLNREPGQAFPLRASVAAYSEVESMVSEVLSRWGRIDVLVNNAGGRWRVVDGVLKANAEPDPIFDTTEAAWLHTLAVNLTGTFNCIKAVGRQMVKQREGHIINIGSGTGLHGTKGTAAYSASKSGLVGLTKVAARELGDYNVQVNTVCPGLILHPRNDVGRGKVVIANEQLKAYKEDQAVLHRTGSAEEFAELVVALSSMTNISGQLINTDSRILF